MSRTAIRGAYFTYFDNPFVSDTKKSVRYESDGLILIKDGRIEACGPYSQLKSELRDQDSLITYDQEHIILPGFLDTHVHYPQIQMTGAYGKHLVDWLNRYVFVSEQDFSKKEHARLLSQIFLRECLRAGTTTSFVYTTVFPDSVDAFFEESEKLGTRMGAGKVLMDRNAPAQLLDTPQSAYDDSKRLLEKWHGNGRQMYCITPRFAPTSTPEQLKLAGQLWSEHPDAYMQTHLSETLNEIEWVKSLYPDRKGYLDVYDHFGLLGRGAIFGHCVHLTDDELKHLYEADASISHCPTSNLFLGSGLFNIEKAYVEGNPLRVGIGSDLGAGTSFFQLATLNEAYKVALLNNCTLLDSPHAFYLLGRGGAHSVLLEETIGCIAPGYEADLTVLDMHATPYLDFRMRYSRDIYDALFLQIICADDRSVHATYVDGECLYKRLRNEADGKFLGRASHLNNLG